MSPRSSPVGLPVLVMKYRPKPFFFAAGYLFPRNYTWAVKGSSPTFPATYTPQPRTT
jgi:hypothetical protein